MDAVEVEAALNFVGGGANTLSNNMSLLPPEVSCIMNLHTKGFCKNPMPACAQYDVHPKATAPTCDCL
jgi:hypothetical protein